jgi:hypothetical protein
MLIQNNVVYWNHGEGIGTGNGSKNTTFRHNIVADNWAVVGLYCDGCDTGMVFDGNLVYLTDLARHWCYDSKGVLTGACVNMPSGSDRSYECGLCLAAELDAGGHTNPGVVLKNNIIVGTNGGIVGFSVACNSSGCPPPPTPSGWQIIGNTIVNTNTGVQVQSAVGGSFSNFTIQNNLFLAMSYSLFTEGPNISPLTMAYNGFSGAANGCGTPPCVFTQSGGHTYTDMGWANSFYDNTNPILVDATYALPRLWACDTTCAIQHGVSASAGTDPSTVDWAAVVAHYQLKTSSPAIDAGATLGAPYNIDYAGVTRPSGPAYDIGAFEYGGTATSPTPTPTPSGSPCSLWDSTQAVPTGFGASFNLFSSAQELLMKAFCNTSSVDYQIGNSSQTEYIYNQGYYIAPSSVPAQIAVAHHGPGE